MKLLLKVGAGLLLGLTVLFVGCAALVGSAVEPESTPRNAESTATQEPPKAEKSGQSAAKRARRERAERQEAKAERRRAVRLAARRVAQRQARAAKREAAAVEAAEAAEAAAAAVPEPAPQDVYHNGVDDVNCADVGGAMPTPSGDEDGLDGDGDGTACE
jgi:membrane protein involved in colicin uptake